jgi:hypothetical protein
METSAVSQWAENKGVDNKGGSDIGLHMTELSRESLLLITWDINQWKLLLDWDIKFSLQ